MIQTIFDFLKAILVGVIASAPLGPVLAFVLQTTLTKGRKAGALAGYGAGIIDTTYSAIAIFALGAVQSFLDDNSCIIMIVGGVLIGLIGISMVFKKTKMQTKATGRRLSAHLPLQTALMSLSNPAAIAVMFALVAGVGINVEQNRILTMFGVWIGTMIWWTFIPWVAGKLGNRLNEKLMNKVKIILGLAIIVFGIIVLVKGIIQI